MCEENVIETESYFLLYYSKYNQLRYNFFTNLNGLFTLYPNFDYSYDDFKLTVLISNVSMLNPLLYSFGNVLIHRNVYVMV